MVEFDVLGGRGGGSGFDAHRVTHVGFDQMLHRGFDGGGEQQRLPRSGHGVYHAGDRGQEPHVEHAVGFIEHEHADAGEIDQFAAEEIVEAAGRSDHDFGALADGFQLRIFAQAADHGGGADAGSIGKLGEGFMDLQREFARGAKDYDARAARAGLRGVGLGAVAQQQFDHGQHKGQRLAGSGLRGGDQVASGEGRFDGKCLNRRRFGEAISGEVAL